MSLADLVREVHHVDPRKASKIFLILEDSRELTVIVNGRHQAMVRVDIKELKDNIEELEKAGQEIVKNGNRNKTS
jgi:hypothetical protein